MNNESRLLLSSRFYAYSKGTLPWGLPNHLWSDAPHLLLFFDHLVCDENALKAEELAATELNFVMSGLFLKLREEGILLPANMKTIVENAKPPSPRLRLRTVEAYYAAHVQQQMNCPLFDWSGKTAAQATTLYPKMSSTQRTRYSKTHGKLKYLWALIGRQSAIVPPLDSLTGEPGTAYTQVLALQKPYWRQLERSEIGFEQYTEHVSKFNGLYNKIDSPLRRPAKRNLDRFLKFRDKTKDERARIAQLITAAFDDDKEMEAFKVDVQLQLARKVPSLFSALAMALPKISFGLATMAVAPMAKAYGYDLPGPDTAGIPPGIAAIKWGVSDIQRRRVEQRAANPLRYMVATAKAVGL